MQKEGRRRARKQVLLLFLGLMALSLWGYAYFAMDDSFSLDKIQPDRDLPFQVRSAYSQEDLEKVKTLFSQPFSFLDQDDDTFVFVSEDGKYVLKLFNMRRFTPKYWLNYIPIPWLDKKRLSKVSEREKARHDIFTSLKNAFDKMRYQTGLVFLHLFRTDFLKIKVTVRDRSGKEHKVSLDRVPFVVQRKATMLGDHIKALLLEGKDEEAVHALCHILVLVKERCKKGFSEEYLHVETGYGFIDGRPMHVAISCLQEDDSFRSARSTLQEVFLMSKALESWLQKKHPSLLPRFQDEVQDLFSFLEEEI